MDVRYQALKLVQMSSTPGTGRRRLGRTHNVEDETLSQIAKEAEARLAQKRAARIEAREIRMRELERQQREKLHKRACSRQYDYNTNSSVSMSSYRKLRPSTSICYKNSQQPLTPNQCYLDYYKFKPSGDSRYSSKSGSSFKSSSFSRSSSLSSLTSSSSNSNSYYSLNSSESLNFLPLSRRNKLMKHYSQDSSLFQLSNLSRSSSYSSLHSDSFYDDNASEYSQSSWSDDDRSNCKLFMYISPCACGIGCCLKSAVLVEEDMILLSHKINQRGIEKILHLSQLDQSEYVSFMSTRIRQCVI
ncbi:unnamed protein product [Clavelina lepadiformis]|uniref:Uncharacterized protein n=1 Tax=Clavelina lepadiformis TaxID=159417 RepID=A0ABP0F657_CLALP